MRGRKAVAWLLVTLTAFPAVAAMPEGLVAGSVASSRGATLRGVALRTGSTILSGETILVSSQGNAAIAFGGGSQVQLAENSELRVGKSNERIEFVLARGRVLFRSMETAPIVGRIADATIQSAGGTAAGLIELRGADTVYIASTKGTLELRTAHDNFAMVLHEGQGVSVPMATEPDPQSNKRKGAAMWGKGRIVLLAGGIAAITLTTALLLGRGKETPPCNAVSPVTCF
jgi:ferric-dicitrate binding protein FerR (iron transport regulator)